jgi:hypothetical protein
MSSFLTVEQRRRRRPTGLGDFFVEESRSVATRLPFVHDSEARGALNAGEPPETLETTAKE